MFLKSEHDVNLRYFFSFIVIFELCYWTVLLELSD